jgi:hypothetical protein
VSNLTHVPPGWYPDPSGAPGARWWDGVQWSDHVAPMETPESLKAPEGTRTGTVWIWLVALLPLVGLVTLFTIDFSGYMNSAMQNPGSMASMLSIYTSPGFIITTIVGWASVAFGIFAAFRDYRALIARKVPSPFHWAFAFLALAGWGIVYAIGRGVVVKRRTGQGQAPMWVAIAVFVVLIVAGIVWAVVITADMLATMQSYTTVT